MVNTGVIIFDIDFQYIENLAIELNDLSMGLTIDEIIEDVIIYRVGRKDIKSYVEYVNECIFSEHVSCDMLDECNSYLMRMIAIINDCLSSSYIDSIPYQVLNVLFDKMNNTVSLIVREERL